MKLLKSLLARAAKEIHNAPNRVRYTMNGFVVAVGCYVDELREEAKKTAAKIGAVSVDMNGTACKVPMLLEYIGKMEARGNLGKKRKMIKC
jgi:hypothetical protein